MTHTFTAKEVMVPFKCDVHGWMNAYVGVLDHPYFAVTDADGKFELKTLPPGTYTIEAWHEKLGTTTQSVTIGAKETKDVTFHFKAPAATDYELAGRAGQAGGAVAEMPPPTLRPFQPTWLRKMLHRFARLVAACTVVLVLAGSLVTSTGSGLAVPDWPTTYGWNMFTFPPSKWVGGIFYEHGHRLIASTVGFLTIVLAVWLWRADPRRWMKRLGAVALGAVDPAGRARRDDRPLLSAGSRSRPRTRVSPRSSSA